MNVLLDKNFLKQLDNFKQHEIYARITVLTLQELPVETIEGRVTGGNINIDGASAVRRTCSINMTAQDVSINNFYWSLSNKFKLEIGLKNFINSSYPDIIWFQQGVYVITSFNATLSAQNFNISISGKDKMCLLNGDVGGSIFGSTDFGTEEYVDSQTGVTTLKKIPIKQIIKEMLHAYALEPYHNIIINDLENKGLELLEYRGDSPMYLLYDIAADSYTQMYFDGQTKCYKNGIQTTLNSLKYNERVDLLDSAADKITLVLNEKATVYTVSKIEFGQTAGYRLTDLTYAGELVSGIGESVTSILDKIIKMLGNFEYFYDLDGRFIFQKKKTYVDTSWNSIVSAEDSYVENSAYSDEITYCFDGNNLISSLQNTPNLSNLKNDYAVWGVRKSASGAELPIHYRYAFHEKPSQYRSFSDVLYTTNQDSLEGNIRDWRELIYQMAVDYFQFGQREDYLKKMMEFNSDLFENGKSGYEQFYTDLQGFWRELYNPQPEKKYSAYSYPNDEEKTFNYTNGAALYIKEKYLSALTANNVDRSKVLVVKENQGNYELHPLINTIDINYDFDEHGVQKTGKYFISAKDGEYQQITQDMSNLISRDEIYVRQGTTYVHILDSVELDDNCYLREVIDDYLDINSLDEKIIHIYKKSDGVFNKYYTISELDWRGDFIENGDTQNIVLEYYIHYYDYYFEDEVDQLEEQPYLYWNKNIVNNPDSINFWFDFLDATGGSNNDSEMAGDLSLYSISAIGDRPKVVNDSSVKSIYFRDVPNVIFTTADKLESTDLKFAAGYTFMYLDSQGKNENQMASDLTYFNISSQGKSAKEALDELIYTHSYCVESINISTIPIYYLQPNTKISIVDKESAISGNYIINRISIPLNYNGMMTIQATKAPTRLY